MSARHEKLIIIGSGPAGYTAAIYGARALLKPVIIAGIQPGGQMTITTDVENYPGFADVIQGPWLMEQMQRQAEHVGAEMVSDTIVEVDLKRRPFWMKGDSGTQYTCDALIIATGAQARWLGLESEEKFKGFGVSACATCDGALFRDKPMAVIGGGDTAMDCVRTATRQGARSVKCLYRRNRANMPGSKAEVANAEEEGVEFVWLAAPQAFDGPKTSNGQDKVATVRAGRIHLGVPDASGRQAPRAIEGSNFSIKADMVVTALGFDAEDLPRLFGEKDLVVSRWGTVEISPENGMTSLPGVFAAGDVQDKTFRQAVTAAGTGCMSALEAEKFLAGQETT